MLLATVQYSVGLLFVLVFILALLRVVDIKTLIVSLVLVIAFFSIKSVDSSIKIRGIQRNKEAHLGSVRALCSVIQSGDIIAFCKPKGFTWYENVFISICAESYFHHGIVVEHNNQKYFYHAYGKAFQQERITEGSGKAEHIVGSVFNWDMVLEPLESYLEFMHGLDSTFCIKRSGIPVIYSEEINQRTVSSLNAQDISIMNCCVGLGEFLSHLPAALPNPFPYYITHVLVYNPLHVTRYYPITQTLYYRVVQN